jgi:hypothetical protein
MISEKMTAQLFRIIRNVVLFSCGCSGCLLEANESSSPKLNLETQVNRSSKVLLEPQAYVTVDAKEIHLLFNRSRLEDTGAWMAVFNLGLDTGLPESFGGLKQVDFKIEGGKLFQYTPGFVGGWQVVTGLRLEEEEGLISAHFPRSYLMNEEVSMAWRLILFPHDRSEPLFLPREVGVVDFSKAWPLQWDHSKVLEEGLIPFAWAMQTQPSLEGDDGLYPSAPLTQQRLATPFLDVNLESSLQSPSFPFFVWPETEGDVMEILSGDISTKLPPKSGVPLLFSRPKKLKNNQLKWVHEVRQRACDRAGWSAIHHIRYAEELPKAARAMVLDWHGDVEKRVVELKAIREKYQGPLFVWYDDSFLSLDTKSRNLSLQSWLQFKLLPMFEPHLNLCKLNHKSVAFLVWFRILQEGGHVDWIEMPPSINLSKYVALRNMSQERYLKVLIRDLREVFQRRKKT